MKTVIINRAKFAVLSISLLTISLAAQSGSVPHPTYEKVCSECHSGGFKGLVTGAPNTSNINDWKMFHEKHNREQMREIVLKGLNDHKVKGGCRRCLDKDIIAAVDYMVDATKPSK